MGNYILGKKQIDENANCQTDDVLILVKKITAFVLGQELRKRCGDEDQQKNLTEHGKATVQFIKAALSFIPEAMDAGADLTNTSFIFAQPGREFAIRAGKGDWEFYFSEQDNGKIGGRCIRKGSILRWLWDSEGAKFVRNAAGTIVTTLLPGIAENIIKRLPQP